MDEQGQATEGVIHFSCEHCQISLTVDDSLAGVTGPCPSCGQAITAPRPDVPRKVAMRPRELKGRNQSSSRTQGDVQLSSRKGSRANSSASTHRRRSISPDTAVSQAHKERAEVAAVAKMLVAGLVVLAIVLAVAFWLNHRFNA